MSLRPTDTPDAECDAEQTPDYPLPAREQTGFEEQIDLSFPRHSTCRDILSEYLVAEAEQADADQPYRGVGFRTLNRCPTRLRVRTVEEAESFLAAVMAFIPPVEGSLSIDARQIKTLARFRDSMQEELREREIAVDVSEEGAVDVDPNAKPETDETRLDWMESL